jgi:DNA-binding CsgD family transcriptional regulator/cell division protein ZapA (FtsZ GTPase activity inhibitor)
VTVDDLPTDVAASQALFGRDTEIASITGFLGREPHSDVGALILSGDAGVGKSALLDVAAAAAAPGGYTVIRTAGVEAESEVGFAALTAVVHRIGTETIAAVEPRYAQALEVALGVREAGTPDARLLGEAVLAALNAAAGSAKLLVIIDDLQVLDRSSAVVLSYVARRLARSTVRMIGAARSDDAPLFEGAGMGELRVLPLPPASAEALLSHRFPRLSGRTRARILEQAAGNPLALIELPAVGADTTHGLSSDALPLTRRLQAVFARRLDGLSSSARALLLLCALEPSISLGELQQIGHVDDVLRTLAPAETLRFVSIEPGGTTVAFRHPLTRAAVVGASTASDRRLAHLKLAEIAPSGSPGQAWHLAHAAIGTDDAVADLLERASRTSSRRGDIHGAIAAMIRAADLSSQLEERRRRMASAAYLSASLLGDLNDVPNLLQAPTPETGAPLVAAVAASYHLLSATGSIDTAHKFLRTALEMEPGDFSPADETMLEAFYTWVRVCYFGNRASLWHDFDRQFARMPNPPAPLQLQAMLLRDPARTGAAATEALDEAVAGLATSSDPLHITRVTVAACYAERLPACRPTLNLVVTAAREGGALPPAIDAVFQLGIDGFLTGRWDETERLVAEGLDWSEKTGIALLQSSGHWLRALIAAGRGRYDQVQDLTISLRRWAAPRGAMAFARYAAHADALAAAGRGDFKMAFAHASSISRAGELEPHVPHALWLVLDLVEAAVRTGRHADARAHVRAAQEAGIAAISSRMNLLVRAAEGVAGSGDPLASFHAALQADDVDTWSFDTARVRLLHGQELHKQGRIAEARAELFLARQTFSDLRASPWFTRTSDELRSTGLRELGHPSGTTADLLTPQQARIASLAARGLTNKEIAKELHLSPRTVSTHLYQIFPKLNVTTRAGLRDALSALARTNRNGSR